MPAATTESSRPSPAKKISKACESCRARKSRCLGGIPCAACRALGQGDQCTVREKARPNRAPPAKSIVSAPAPNTTPIIDSRARLPLTDLSSPRSGPTAPLLNSIQLALVLRGLEHDLPYDDLVFEDDQRLSRVQQSQDLPCSSTHKEEDLIQTFVHSPEFEIIRVIDRDELLRIFSRYRIRPDSITHDQLALIKAALCLAEHNKITSNTFSPIGWHSAITGESMSPVDVTLFFSAKRHIFNWSNPSIVILWAICTLLPYAMLKGGASECTELLDRMAWHVEALGIHRPEISALFPLQDAAEGIFSTFVYYDTFIAGLHGTTPLLISHNLINNTSPTPTLYPHCLRQVTVHELDFLTHVAAHAIDEEYSTSCQRLWASATREVRLHPDITVGQNLRNWAELRYCWLRILLHAPSLVDPSPQHDPIPLLSRSISQMLHIYSEADSIGHFRESWQQLRQLVTCAHILILGTSAGEFHRSEANALWNMLVRFVVRLAIFWPSATKVLGALRKAAMSLHIQLDDASAPQPVLDLEQIPMDGVSIFDGFGAMLPFDFGLN